MANSVKFAIPEREIDNVGVNFVRRHNGSKHGEMAVWQNHIGWKPASHEFYFMVTWEEFAEFAEQLGRRAKGKTAGA